MDTIYFPVSMLQSGENVAGLTNDKAYIQFLSDMKGESRMNPKERFHLITILRQQGRELNCLIENPLPELQL